MSYKYKENHTKINYTKGCDKRLYLVIHFTGNKTDTAKANANYFKSVNRGASAHLFVDDNTIYEVVGLNNTAWAVGKNYGKNNLFGKCTNRNSISIEMCSTNGKISDKTFQNTVSITKELMKKYNIKAENVVRHYDVCSKSCPGWTGWVGKDTTIWEKFKNSLKSTSKKGTICVSSAPIRAKNKKLSKKLGVAKRGTSFEVISVGKSWTKINYNGTTGYVYNKKITVS